MKPPPIPFRINTKEKYVRKNASFNGHSFYCSDYYLCGIHGCIWLTLLNLGINSPALHLGKFTLHLFNRQGTLHLNRLSCLP